MFRGHLSFRLSHDKLVSLLQNKQMDLGCEFVTIFKRWNEILWKTSPMPIYMFVFTSELFILYMNPFDVR